MRSEALEMEKENLWAELAEIEAKLQAGVKQAEALGLNRRATQIRARLAAIR